VLQYVAQAGLIRAETAAYLQTLVTGFERYPDSPYFFKYLAMYYSRQDRYADVLRIAETVLKRDPENIAALLSKSSALLRERRYEECVSLCDSIIDIDANRSLTYINAGLAYYNRILELSAKKTKTNEERRTIDDWYKRALPYFEMFRRLEPGAIDRWGAPLYDIYYNLNMGDEFEEMERLLGETN
ncbi:MAG: hypothetical protein LUC22_01790, partial [Prevotella sp.]|nr:hypothetical protein [Prevotella sp.]